MVGDLAKKSRKSRSPHGERGLKLVNYNYKNPDFDQPVGLDDMLALALLPPYLAAELLSAENDVLSAWFMNQYREALQDVRSNAAGEFEAIPTPYGLF